MEDRSLSWSTSTSGSLESMILSRLCDLFTIDFRSDDIQEFDSSWDGYPPSMTKIPSYDILESLYKLRIRESAKLKTVLELYNMEIHQMNAGPDYHRLKTMVKRSIEQNIRNKNFEARNGNYERNVVVYLENQEDRLPVVEKTLLFFSSFKRSCEIRLLRIISNIMISLIREYLRSISY